MIYRENSKTRVITLTNKELENLKDILLDCYYCYSENNIYMHDSDNCYCIDYQYDEIIKDINKNNYISYSDIKEESLEGIYDSILDNLEHYNLGEINYFAFNGLIFDLETGKIIMLEKRDICNLWYFQRELDKKDIEFLEEENYKYLQNAYNQ